MIDNEAITQEKPLYIKAFRLFAIALCCGLSLLLSLFKGVRGIC